MNPLYHQPVLRSACIDGLKIKPKGIYLDLTFGGGGHSRAILERLGSSGRLIAFDQDASAAHQSSQFAEDNFEFVAANFRHFKKYLKLYGVKQVDGLLADLGVSSYQIDTPERGFSTRFSAQLDMRMNAKTIRTAREVLNESNEEQLHRILGQYGEVKNAKTLAQAIIRWRTQHSLETTDDLLQVLTPYAPRGRSYKYFAQVFQALRIEVNDELKALEEMLLDTPEIIRPGGRLVILSYHSLEDRLVKNFIQKGKFHGEVEKDLFGHYYTPFQAVNRKPISASDEEIAQNNRARSAKLRIAERTANEQ
ncbi:MAG: 16S rRNA (cytosine(1402)-N(4))-methyltransferase RsmH [Bacteroidia bacterium]|nr:16S rRNA (cytosine(1402)-N(4))-methyltransferase RsmH [Bacteroidia bacterium]